MSSRTYLVRLIGCCVYLGNDDISMPLRMLVNGGNAVNLARHLAGTLSKGRVEVMTSDNMLVASFQCWNWENN